MKTEVMAKKEKELLKLLLMTRMTGSMAKKSKSKSKWAVRWLMALPTNHLGRKDLRK